MLLYDLTSTYFESPPPDDDADKRRHGYSRDKRSDCVLPALAPPSRYDAPTMRVTTISESTAGRILGCLPRRTKRCARGQNGFQVDSGVNFK